MLNNNTIYNSQFASLSFITMITFKTAMLPKYLASAVGRDSWITVLIMVAIELLMYVAVYYTARRINLQEEKNKVFIAPIMLAIFMLSMVRVIVLYSEMVDYTATTLFDHRRSIFIIITFAPVLGYLVYKGGNVIARLGEILLYVVVAVIATQTVLIQIDLDWSNILPVMVDNGDKVGKGIYNHFMWFGDFIPLLFFSVVNNKNKIMAKISVPIALTVAGVLVVLFFLVFTAAYGGAGILVNYAFNKMAVFNKISALVGASNALSVTTWLIMALLQLSMLIYSAAMSLSYFIKKKNLAIVIVIVAVSLIEAFWVQNVNNGYAFATSWVKWGVAAIQYTVPVILAGYARYKTSKAKLVKNDKAVQTNNQKESSDTEDPVKNSQLNGRKSEVSA